MLTVVRFGELDAVFKQRHLVGLAMEPLGVGQQAIEIENNRGDHRYFSSR